VGGVKGGGWGKGRGKMGGKVREGEGGNVRGSKNTATEKVLRNWEEDKEKVRRGEGGKGEKGGRRCCTGGGKGVGERR